MNATQSVKSSIIPGVCVGCNRWDPLIPTNKVTLENDGPLARVPNWWMTMVFEFGDVWGKPISSRKEDEAGPASCHQGWKDQERGSVGRSWVMVMGAHQSRLNLRIQFRFQKNSRAIKRNWIGPNTGYSGTPKSKTWSWFIILWNRNVVFLFFPAIYVNLNPVRWTTSGNSRSILAVACGFPEMGARGSLFL